MKTFKQFQEQISLQRAFSQVGKPGGGVGDWERSTTSLKSLSKRVTSDMSKPKGSTSGIPTTPLSKATYASRARTDIRPGTQSNPDYVGPVGGLGGSAGTRDVRMPGTTPSRSAGTPGSGYIKSQRRPSKFSSFT